jgi:hypothetical protein
MKVGLSAGRPPARGDRPASGVIPQPARASGFEPGGGSNDDGPRGYPSLTGDNSYITSVDYQGRAWWHAVQVMHARSQSERDVRPAGSRVVAGRPTCDSAPQTTLKQSSSSPQGKSHKSFAYQAFRNVAPTQPQGRTLAAPAGETE